MKEHGYNFFGLFDLMKYTLMIGGIPDIYRKVKIRGPMFYKATRVMFWVGTINMIYTLVAETAYGLKAVKSIESFLEFSEVMGCCVLCVNAVVKSIALERNEKLIEDIVEDLRKIWPEKVDDTDKEIMDRTLIPTKKVINVYIYLTNTLAFVFNVFPVIFVVIDLCLGKETKLLMPYYIWYPFDPEKYATVFAILFMAQQHAGWYTAYGIICGDCFLFALLAQVSMQFFMLCERMERISKHDDNTTIEQRIVVEEQRLKDIVRAHNNLIGIIKKINEVFNVVLFVNITLTSVINCLQMFSLIISPLTDKIKYALFLVYSLQQMFMICYYGNWIQESSQKMMHSAFGCDWHGSDRKLRQSMILIIATSFIPVQLTALSYIPVTTVTFFSILNASYAYFNLLRTMYQKFMGE